MSQAGAASTFDGIAGAIWSVFAAVVFMFVLSACASEPVKRAAYESIHQKQCMDRTGMLNCDPEHQHYEDYKKERETLQRSVGDDRPPE